MLRTARGVGILYLFFLLSSVGLAPAHQVSTLAPEVEIPANASAPHRPWLSGRVASLADRIDLVADVGEPSALILEALGSEQPPVDARVDLFEITAGDDWLREIVDGRAESVAEETVFEETAPGETAPGDTAPGDTAREEILPAASVSPDASGRFELRTPSPGRWRLEVSAPGFVTMEMVLSLAPDRPNEHQLPTVWLVPAVTDELDLNQVSASPVSAKPETTSLTAHSGVEGTSTSGLSSTAPTSRAWWASMTSKSPALSAQRSVGGWQRRPIRAWGHERGVLLIARAADEELILLAKDASGREIVIAAGGSIAGSSVSTIDRASDTEITRTWRESLEAADHASRVGPADGDPRTINHAIAEGRVTLGLAQPGSQAQWSGVDLVAIALAGERSIQWARLDRLGQFRLERLRPKARYHLLALHRDYPVSDQVFVAPEAGDIRQDILVQLDNPLDAIGWITSASTGLPLQGARVQLTGGPGTLGVPSAGLSMVTLAEPQGEGLPAVVTDEGGRFVFDDIEAGTYGVNVSAPDHADAFVPNLEIVREAVGWQAGRFEFEVGSFVLVPEAPLDVRVVDSSLQPIVGASVSWNSELVPRSSQLRFATRRPGSRSVLHPPWSTRSTDERGEVTLVGIEPESSVSIEVDAEGFVSRRVNELVVDWSSMPAPVSVVEMVLASRLSGRVEDAQGRPLAEVHVSLHPVRAIVDFPSNAFTRTDSRGEFAFAALPAGDLTIRARAQHHATIEPLALTLGHQENREGVVLRAPESAVVEGRIRTWESFGAALSEWSILCGGDLAKFDENGEFRIENSLRGVQQIEVRFGGEPLWEQQLDVRPGGNWVEIDLTARSAHSEGPGVGTYAIGGRLTQNGEPATSPDAFDDVVVSLVHASGRRVAVLRGPFGQFLAQGLEPGEYMLSARGGDGRWSVERLTLDDSDRRSVTLDFSVTLYGSIRLQIEGLDEREEERVRRFGLAVKLEGEPTGTTSRSITRSATWTGDGFLLERVPVGAWIVEATPSEGVYFGSKSVVIHDEGDRVEATLVFQRSDRIRVQGRLLVDGVPTSGWIVSEPFPQDRVGLAAASEPDQATINGLGQFELTTPPGPLWMSVTTGGSVTGIFSADARPGGEILLDLRLQSISGRVIGSDGRPLERLKLVAQRIGASLPARPRATTRPDGSFRFHALTLGEGLRVSVYPAGADYFPAPDSLPLWSQEIGPDFGEITIVLPP